MIGKYQSDLGIGKFCTYEVIPFNMLTVCSLATGLVYITNRRTNAIIPFNMDCKKNKIAQINA